MASFSTASIYFSINILFISIFSAILTKSNKIKTAPPISTILIISIVFSHLFQIINLNFILEQINTKINLFHIYFGYFLALSIFLLIGFYLLKFTKINKQLLFFPIAIIFVHIIYLFFSYDSFQKQKQIYENINNDKSILNLSISIPTLDEHDELDILTYIKKQSHQIVQERFMVDKNGNIFPIAFGFGDIFLNEKYDFPPIGNIYEEFNVEKAENIIFNYLKDIFISNKKCYTCDYNKECYTTGYGLL